MTPGPDDPLMAGYQRCRTSVWPGDQIAMGSATSFGALSLYLDFINLFQFLLVFLSQRR